MRFLNCGKFIRFMHFVGIQQSTLALAERFVQTVDIITKESSELLYL